MKDPIGDGGGGGWRWRVELKVKGCGRGERTEGRLFGSWTN